jgi:hypothetical protein
VRLIRLVTFPVCGDVGLKSLLKYPEGVAGYFNRLLGEQLFDAVNEHLNGKRFNQVFYFMLLEE